MMERLLTGRAQPRTCEATALSATTHLRRRRIMQRLAFGLLWMAGLVGVVVLLGVVGYVLWAGAKVIDWEFITTAPRGGLAGEGGISTTIVTTLYLVGLTLAIAAPLGVGAAVYLVEYAEEAQGSSGLAKRVIGVARFGVETLAGVPSIVFGLFGYALFVVTMGFGFSLLAAALTGACLILPVIIRTTEEALKAVPRSYREGSLALGATKWQTIWQVVLPAAGPGVITGIVLGVGRVVSETAVFYVTLGGNAAAPRSLLQGGRTMALHVYYLAMDTRAFDRAMGTGAILVVTIVLINVAITFLSRRYTRRMMGNE